MLRNTRNARILTLIVLLLSTWLSGCSVNPVTGKKQLMFTDFSDDIRIGQEQYEPAQQSQGGEYTRDPALSAYVKQVGQKLARVSDRPDLPYEFVILNNSVPNAWALPSGKIAINRGLLTQLENEAQLAAVLAHEIVHAAARHGAQRMRDSLLMQAGMAGLGLTLADNDYRGLIVGAASLGAGLTIAKYGREHELESDHYGMKYMAKAGYDPMGAVELQELFVKWSKGGQSNWLEGLFASHPPSQERVQANRRTAAELNVVNGRIGREDYQRAIAKLKADSEAYAKADKAAAELQKKNPEKAAQLIDSALSKAPDEALFHSLKGQALLQQGQAKAALNSHNKAVALNPNQFSYYLNRAQTHAQLNNSQKALADYQASMQKLPTSIAALQLGQLHANSGQSDQARQYFQLAASAPGQTGTEARRALNSMQEVPVSDQGLVLKHLRDPQGRMFVTIENTRPHTVNGLTLVSEISNAQGQVLQRSSWRIELLIPTQRSTEPVRIPVIETLPEGQMLRTRVVDVR